MTPKLFRPTDEQTRIIHHDGSAFISACPGAGKTRVLVERARFLSADQAAGRGVAFLSFTIAAVSELEDRLRHEGLLELEVFAQTFQDDERLPMTGNFRSSRHENRISPDEDRR